MARLPAEFKNALVPGDCLEVMARLPGACLDLIYIDPPFGTGKQRKGENLPLDAGGRIRKPGKGAARVGEPYQFQDAWQGNLDGYLAWMELRLEEMVRLLKPTGSLLVHLDWHASHYIKVMLDRIMGPNRFVNEIIWHYRSGGHSKNRLARKYDSIFWYAGGKTFTYNPDAAGIARNRCPLCGSEGKRKNHMKREKDRDGNVVMKIRSGGRVYSYAEGRPAPPSDLWLDISHLHQRDPERTGWPTQKPLKLLERLVGLCSNPGDVVADFFAGTGTTLIAAARGKRTWLGCEARDEAIDLAAGRFRKLSLPFRVQGRQGRKGRKGKKPGSLENP
jgi:site-specific DNA-methyltransferase (adenine-specific)/adenine-specific DNA-methyltransferase